VRLIDALSYSYNIATVRLGLEVGVDRVVGLLRRLGLNRKVEAFPSLLLGAVNMTPVEMAQLYLGFASGGFLMPLRTTLSVLNQNMEPLARYPLSLQQVIGNESMTVLNAGLQAVVTKGTARSLGNRFSGGLGLAGKTGTTDGYRDSWYAGYAGNYLVVVWVGRDDNKPTRLTGASGAMQIWGDIMANMHVQPVDLPVPGSIEYAQVDQHGQLATDCAGAITLPFAPNTLPDRVASCAKGKKRARKPARKPAAKKSWLERLFDTDRK
jgi:penicillin-binding protein 1B